MIEGKTLLGKLPMVVLDLETTGLNVATDKIVQIGAVWMDGQKIDYKSTYDQLINPGMVISKKITKIHQISDASVKGQPLYKDKHKELHDFIDERVVVGHNIGFDLAIIRNETERLGFPQLNYRYLDIKLLGMLLNFPGTGLYLENLSEYFGIEIKDRHNARGDAILTAQIFEQMIPLLFKKGVTTLSIAEKLCYEKAQAYSLSYSSDWYYIQPPGFSPEPIKQQSWNMMERIDPFPFSHIVQEFMAKKLITVKHEDKIPDVIKTMAKLSIASVLVENKGKIIGIITERDILRVMNNFQKDAFKKVPHEIMSSPLKTISQTAFLYQAIEMLEVNMIRHLPVHNDDGKIVGILSNRDVNRKRITNFYRNQTNLEKAKNSEDLHEIFAQIPILTQRLFKEEVSPKRVTQVISTECISLTRRATELAEVMMKKEKIKRPEGCYSVLVLGSAGRGESMLAFDQDNAIIYELPANTNDAQKVAAKEWYLKLGKYMNQILHEAGIPLCKGNIMAGNPDWCMDEETWRKKVMGWFSTSNKKDILNADIFLDLKYAYGDTRLVYNLKKFSFDKGAKCPIFHKMVGEEIIEHAQAPLNMFGNIKSEAGWIDMKKTILFPIVALGRLFALKMGYHESDTFLRLEKAKKKLHLNSYEIEMLQEVQKVVFPFVLKQQLNSLDLGESPNTKVYLPHFSKRETENLKRILPSLKWVETMIRDALSE